MNSKVVTAHAGHHQLCVSCGRAVTDKFCAACGEKQVDAHDFALKHYLEESVEGFTHFDNKFFRSALSLVTRPGMLSENFSIGRRVNFLKPFQFFLISNLLFFFLAGKLNIFSVALSNFYQYAPFTWFGTRQVIEQKAHTNAEFETLALAFNERMGTESKLFIVLFIPVLALGCCLLFVNKRKYLSEHLVFATHFFSFILLYYTAFTLLIFKPFYWITGIHFSGTFDMITSLGNLLVIGVYFFLAARRFYKAGVLQAVPAALLITVLFTISLYAYRLLLFFKIVSGIHLNG